MTLHRTGRGLVGSWARRWQKPGEVKTSMTARESRHANWNEFTFGFVPREASPRDLHALLVAFGPTTEVECGGSLDDVP